MKVIESRQHPGYRRRRYDDGRTTYEVDASVVRHFGMRNFKQAVATTERGRERRAAGAATRAAVNRRLAEGWKPTAIAHELGISDARVRQIRSEACAP